MACRAIRVALLIATLPTAGCGTVANLVYLHPEEGGKSPFGGVRQDALCIQKAANEESTLRTHPEAELEHNRQMALLVLGAMDLPFSLIGDVVTWPYTAAYTCINQPVPVPPMALAPSPPPVPHADGRIQTAPLETLPQPKTLP
jgi:uncharacterized protein YceK